MTQTHISERSIRASARPAGFSPTPVPQEGETLAEIASRYGVDIEELKVGVSDGIYEAHHENPIHCYCLNINTIRNRKQIPSSLEDAKVLQWTLVVQQ